MPAGQAETSVSSAQARSTLSRRASSSVRPKRMLCCTEPRAMNGVCGTSATEPRNAAEPEMSERSPSSAAISALLPPPTGPTTATKSPEPASRSSPLSAGTPRAASAVSPRSVPSAPTATTAPVCTSVTGAVASSAPCQLKCASRRRTPTAVSPPSGSGVCSGARRCAARRRAERRASSTLLETMGRKSMGVRSRLTSASTASADGTSSVKPSMVYEPSMAAATSVGETEKSMLSSARSAERERICSTSLARTARSRCAKGSSHTFILTSLIEPKTSAVRRSRSSAVSWSALLAVKVALARNELTTSTTAMVARPAREEIPISRQRNHSATTTCRGANQSACR
mmetsp:Transcript_32862/g.81666  ORF Transcript_32862/g.81666 Transcript_32862/m.81666 type:complete len:343 (-) Transcript_32862:826-1854(-)